MHITKKKNKILNRRKLVNFEIIGIYHEILTGHIHQKDQIYLQVHACNEYEQSLREPR